VLLNCNVIANSPSFGVTDPVSNPTTAILVCVGINIVPAGKFISPEAKVPSSAFVKLNKLFIATKLPICALAPSGIDPKKKQLVLQLLYLKQHHHTIPTL